MTSMAAEWRNWLQTRVLFARVEQDGENHSGSHDSAEAAASSPSSTSGNNVSNSFYNPWNFMASLQNVMMGLKAKTSGGMLHVGIAGVAALLLLLLLFQSKGFLSGEDAEIRQAQQAGQDMVYASIPTYNCSKLGLKGEQQAMEVQQYHAFFPDAQAASSRCQSKFQQHCFRKNSGPQYFPPPKFLSVLRGYEAYHESCTKGKKLTALGISGDAPHGCKYLVWKAKDGMGNQLLSLVCAFVYSLLTDRVMLIATDSHMDSLICNPFPHSSWVLPRDFPEQRLRSKAKRVHVYLRETLATVQRRYSGNSIPPALLPFFISRAPKHLHAYIICCDARRDHQFFCPTAQKLFSGSNWLFYLSHEYTLPALYFIPEFREKLNDWFPNHDVFMHASRYLLNPQNEVWAQIVEFYRAHMNGAAKQIGIQPRSWTGDYIPSISRQISRCAVEQHLLPKTMEAEKLRNETTDAAQPKPADISVLVTSLRAEYWANLAREYATHPNVDGLVVDVFTASSEGLQRTGNAAHDAKALAEIWLLSFTQDLVTTPLSTFGSTASGMAGIVPLLFNNYGKDVVWQPACARTNAGGPCFIVFPRNQPCDLDPPQFSIIDPSTKVPEVKYCDYNPGLGIVTTS